MTPKSYLGFLESYKRIYGEQREQLGDAAVRMNTGLGKLEEAGQSVAQLKQELAKKEQELAVASDKAEKVLCHKDIFIGF